MSSGSILFSIRTYVSRPFTKNRRLYTAYSVDKYYQISKGTTWREDEHLRGSTWNLNAKILKLVGFEMYSKWTLEEYIEFVNKSGFTVEKSIILTVTV